MSEQGNLDTEEEIEPHISEIFPKYVQFGIGFAKEFIYRKIITKRMIWMVIIVAALYAIPDDLSFDLDFHTTEKAVTIPATLEWSIPNL